MVLHDALLASSPVPRASFSLRLPVVEYDRLKALQAIYPGQSINQILITMISKSLDDLYLNLPALSPDGLPDDS